MSIVSFRASRSALGVGGVLALVMFGCSLRQAAVSGVGGALAAGSESWARDDDPDLIRDAAPFALKTIESLLDEAPDDQGLLLAATRGFAQYSYAWAQQEADFVESENLAEAFHLRNRAQKLYLRAMHYGQHALDLRAPTWRSDSGRSLKRLGRNDVPLLYWTAIAWGGAISLSKDDAELSADLGLAESLMARAMELDESFELGAIHDFYIVYDGGRPASAGGSIDRARRHLDRARQLSGGHRAAPLVTFAETVSVSTQNREEFQSLLEEAIAIDTDVEPAQRLANTLYQERAKWLLSRVDDLFVE